jgi:hypothetical protein
VCVAAAAFISLTAPGPTRAFPLPAPAPGSRPGSRGSRSSAPIAAMKGARLPPPTSMCLRPNLGTAGSRGQRVNTMVQTVGGRRIVLLES